MPLITDMENLREAFLRASKGKRGKRAVIDFEENLENRLGKIRTFPFFRNVECMPLVAMEYDMLIDQRKMHAFFVADVSILFINPSLL